MPKVWFDEQVAAGYDEHSPEMFDPAVLGPTVDFLADLAGGGSALELGIGTGRVALPLSRRGVRVHGIDLSAPMVERLRAKPGGAAIDVTVGDFATTTVDGTFDLAYLVPPGEVFRTFHHDARHLGFDEYDVATQLMYSHHYRFGENGTYERFSVPFRYVWPAELDLMARLAGMRLRERWADWSRAPCTSESRSHVSVWELPPA
jgi:SAM-dependent methyltransferase